ncbi:MAG TPA: NAD-dependent epimerase/dehydratase family protein [Solirubrobacteraceae bacterium]|nr:NAD-dependent epimerase/dehydratase family protein [Solirubrobacteraceae bacterium]
MPRTLVTGATGFLGSHLTRLLVRRGDEVRALVRPSSDLEALTKLDVATDRGDVLDRRSVRRALRGVDRVFHAAGTTNLRLSREEMFALNVEGTRIVLEEALRAGVERVIYTSSVAAIGPARRGSVATEATGWDAARYGIAYVDSKHAAEGLALALGKRGLPVVIVNPATLLGPGDRGRSSTVLVRRFMRRQIPAYVDGTLNIVGVQDVARGHLLADERGRLGERYILGNRNFTMDRLFADLARLSGIDPPALRLPVRVALALAEGGQWVAGGAMPSPEEVRIVSLNWACSSAKAKRELGWRTSPHEDCLEETIAWYREREGALMSPPGSRQPVALRVAGAFVRHTPVGWG